MKIIGLTGPSGAGKSEICALLARAGIPSINADKVYHNLLIPPSKCLDAIRQRFGDGVLSPDGTLDRPALAAIVFADGAEDKRSELNRITHYYVIDKMRSLMSGYSRSDIPALILDVPLLFESELVDDCDLTVSVIADPAIRAERIMKRDGLDYNAAYRRISSQQPDDFYISRSDLVVYNNSDADELAAEVGKILSAAGISEEK